MIEVVETFLIWLEKKFNQRKLLIVLRVVLLINFGNKVKTKEAARNITRFLCILEKFKVPSQIVSLLTEHENLSISVCHK